MAPISATFLAPQATSTASASASVGDSATLLSEITNSPLIAITISVWAVVCVVAICIWLRRATRNGAGVHWIPADEKGSLRKRASWRKCRGSGKYHGLGLPVFTEKASFSMTTPEPATHPLRVPRPARIRTVSTPRLVPLSPCTPTVVTSPPATPVFPIFGNTSTGGAPFWAPAWALQAAEARANIEATPAPASPTFSPTMPSSTWSPLTPDIDFPEVPPEIVARIRREPFPMFVGE
ncbi:hypothetical protein C8Q72DRAFT_842815 [Fomitopsis betulina]|nr:hypothetical protein C8Q72DRAFT_842815 [Fomitopsis betulina]